MNFMNWRVTLSLLWWFTVAMAMAIRDNQNLHPNRIPGDWLNLLKQFDDPNAKSVSKIITYLPQSFFSQKY